MSTPLFMAAILFSAVNVLLLWLAARLIASYTGGDPVLTFAVCVAFDVAMQRYARLWSKP